jgi:hypothetical protein
MATKNTKRHEKEDRKVNKAVGLGGFIFLISLSFLCLVVFFVAILSSALSRRVYPGGLSVSLSP